MFAEVVRNLGEPAEEKEEEEAQREHIQKHMKIMNHRREHINETCATYANKVLVNMNINSFNTV